MFIKNIFSLPITKNKKMCRNYRFVSIF